MAVAQLHPGQTIAPNVILDQKTQTIIPNQEATNTELGAQGQNAHYLIVSPYVEREHQLDLRTVDTENALLAKALVHMKSLRPDYATAPYTETFNWSDMMEKLGHLAQESKHKWKETSFYIVAFRSQIPPSTQYSELGKLDKDAHAEATASGGFLKWVSR